MQGVGKNKLADRALQLLNIEREYMQLHRDSTVQSLTLSPSLKDGVVVWDDSPLVRAVTHGRTLVVDEVCAISLLVCECFAKICVTLLCACKTTDRQSSA